MPEDDQTHVLTSSLDSELELLSRPQLEDTTWVEDAVTLTLLEQERVGCRREEDLC